MLECKTPFCCGKGAHCTGPVKQEDEPVTLASILDKTKAAADELENDVALVFAKFAGSLVSFGGGIKKLDEASQEAWLTYYTRRLQGLESVSHAKLVEALDKL